MASALRQVSPGQLYIGPNIFDMWRDYMGLSKLLLRLRDMPVVDHGETHERQAQTGAPPARKNSTSSHSSSSLSDSASGGPSYCRFCKQNGETARVYRSHRLKEKGGRVVCPVLWSYTCPICEATGDQAHTRKYCPELQRQEAQARCAHW